LHQDTPVFTGTEKIARKLNAPVVFAAVRRVRRGYYSVHLHLITDNPSQHQEGWITQEHTRLLEEEIKRQPEIWLWSHRRWKHKRLK
jgi:KDO2-lipid IV(A) lauroyltransferase